MAKKRTPQASPNPDPGLIAHLPPGRHAELPPDKIAIEPGFNARQVFEEAPLLALGRNLADLGQVQEIIVSEEDGRYVLLNGERRVRAAKAAGLDLVQCVIYKGLTPLQKVRVAHAADFHRADLNHMERARRYQSFADAGLTIPQIAAETGDGDDTIRRHLALLSGLTPAVQEQVAAGRIPVRQAELLTRVKAPAQQEELAAVVISGWGSKGRTVAEAAAAPMEDGPIPAEQLAQEIAYACGDLGEVEWPKASPYAGRCSCAACPSNTALEPELFAERIGGRAQVEEFGHCLDRACWDTKAEAWKEDPQGRKIEHDRKKSEKDREAKARTRDSAGGEGGRKKERVFPESPAEKLAVAQHAWGEDTVEALAKAGGKLMGDPAGALALVYALLVAAHCHGNGGGSLTLVLPKGNKADLDALAKTISDEKTALPFPPGTLSAWLNGVNLWWFRPQYWAYNDLVEDVPLKPRAMGILKCLAAMAVRWAVKVPKIPDASDFPEEDVARSPEPVTRKKGKTRGAGK